MTDWTRIYGADVRPEASERMTHGRVSFSLHAGAVRHLCVDGVEVLRNIAFLGRDRDWGTLVPQITEIPTTPMGGDWVRQFQFKFDNNGVGAHIDLKIQLTESQMCITAWGRTTGDFETNRLGFTVLHPAHVAGAPVTIDHADGRTTDTVFPDLIDPWRPFMDIKTMTHRRDGLTVAVAFDGDTFETEDQRQWGDASYKTYNRSLDLPWPYVIAAGEQIQQSVTITWRDDPMAAPVVAAPQTTLGVFPQTALAITAQDAARLATTPDALPFHPARFLCAIDGTLGDMAAQIEMVAGLQRALPDVAYDLELIFPFAASVQDEMTHVRAAMDRHGPRADSVMICPAVDRQSTPPGSAWPDCPPLDEIHATAATVFADIMRGGGMVSFFPELNRKRPPLTHLDFVSHGLCAIVHAADDVSVMETLQTIPHITRSARAIIGDRAYRIGPCTIAMRQNPYGSRTMDNPDLIRVPMAHDDPRHRGDFGACYAIGLAAALAPAGIAVWTPAAVFGPRGVMGDWPIVTVLAALSRLGGQQVHAASVADGLARLQIGDTTFFANLTDAPHDGLSPYEWRLDTDQENG